MKTCMSIGLALSAVFVGGGVFPACVFGQTERAAVRTWTVDGVQREAIVIRPAVKSDQAPPLVLVFHGHGGNMRNTARQGFAKAWPEAVVVCPQGLPTATPRDPEGLRSGWQTRAGNQKDRDLKFVDAIIKTMRESENIDDQRICATGHSNGGGFTYLLWFERGSVLAAAAPSACAPLGALRGAKELVKLPVIHIGGRTDPVVPFAGQTQMMEEVRSRLGCPDESQPWHNAGDLVGAVRQSPDNPPFVSLIHPGGHEYPAAAPGLIVKFFQTYGKKPKKS